MGLTIALAGQPNCGKSTIFNALAGYRANTANFPGTTVAYTASEAMIAGQYVRIIDLPGAYSLASRDPAEQVARDYLLSGQADVVLAVLDATLLARGLEMLLEVLGLGMPVVVALNMMDEAQRRGIEIDVTALAERLGVAVVPTVAVHGHGVVQAAWRAVQVAESSRHRAPPPDPGDALARHSAAQAIVRDVVRVHPAQGRPVGERLDDLLMHPAWGVAIAALVFASLFLVTFFVGGALSDLVGGPFERLRASLRALAGDHWAWALLKGLADGVAVGLGIVLPYLVPLLSLLALLEDVGYLPRAAFLVDGLFHRIGLHGKSVVPFILGYGCNVPALLGTRILETPRDRVLTALLVPLIPCSARTVVILALVAAVLGPLYALAIYLLDLAVVALSGRVLSAVVPGPPAGLLMDVPPWRAPAARMLARKVWFRTYQFLVGAWPILVAASLAMAILEVAGVDAYLNDALRPVTEGLLGLPAAVGVTLFFGLLRKELSLLLLFQALGTENVASVLTPAQLVTFTLFVTFYVPCVATIATLVREIGWRWTGVSVALSTALALAIGSLSRLVLG